MNSRDSQSELRVIGYNWQGKKVLVTGASGFKGSWLCKVLLELGAEVHGTTAKLVNPLSAYDLLDLGRDIVTINADISERQQVFDMLNSVTPDVIFHLAAKAQVTVAERDPRRAFDVNIMGTLNILEGCRQLGVGKRILIVSTDHVFGRVFETDQSDVLPEKKLPKWGFREDNRVSYGGIYDTSKSAMELCTRAYHSEYWSKLPAIGILRAANVYGFGDVAQRRVIPNFVRCAVSPVIVLPNRQKEPHQIPITVKRHGRQFVHITDVIEGYIRAASSLDTDDPDNQGIQKPERSPFTPTFHFATEEYENYAASGEPFIRIESLGLLIAETFKEHGAKVFYTDDCRDYNPNENPVQALNCKETHKNIGWRPQVRLEEGIRDLGEWYQSQSSPDILKRLLKKDIGKILDSLPSAKKPS